jgi:hypothetical protein
VHTEESTVKWREMSESGREREKSSYALDSLSQLFVYKQFPPDGFLQKADFPRASLSPSALSRNYRFFRVRSSLAHSRMNERVGERTAEEKKEKNTVLLNSTDSEKILMQIDVFSACIAAQL